MFSVHRRRSARLPERIFAKLANLQTPQTLPVQISPFTLARWPHSGQDICSWDADLPIADSGKFELAAEEPPKVVLETAASPQSEEHHIPSKEIIRANRVVELQRRHVDLVNQRQPFGCHVMALSLIPAEVWQGANATFMMMACDFFPASAANTLLLPVTRKGADHLHLPQYPFNCGPERIEAARMDVSKLRLAFSAEHKQVVLAMQRGDMSCLSNRPARKKKYAEDLKNLAGKMAVARFGKQILQDHQTVFGDALGYETPPPL